MSEENKYFHTRDKDRLEQANREKMRQELRKHEISLISDLLATTPELASKVYQLGFDAEAARFFHLLPLLQIAWEGGILEQEKKERLIALAKLRGVSEEIGGPAWAFFDLLLTRKPDQPFFDQVNTVLAAMLAEGGATRVEPLLSMCIALAKSSNHLFSAADAASEQKQLEAFAKLFTR